MFFPSSHWVVAPVMGVISVVQAVIVFLTGIVGSSAIIPAVVGGIFLLINSAMTVLFTRWLEERWKRDMEVRKEGKAPAESSTAEAPSSAD